MYQNLEIIENNLMSVVLQKIELFKENMIGFVSVYGLFPLLGPSQGLNLSPGKYLVEIKVWIQRETKALDFN